jgi:hypothetical protein
LIDIGRRIRGGFDLRCGKRHARIRRGLITTISARNDLRQLP